VSYHAFETESNQIINVSNYFGFDTISTIGNLLSGPTGLEVSVTTNNNDTTFYDLTPNSFGVSSTFEETQPVKENEITSFTTSSDAFDWEEVMDYYMYCKESTLTFSTS